MILVGAAEPVSHLVMWYAGVAGTLAAVALEIVDTIVVRESFGDQRWQ